MNDGNACGNTASKMICLVVAPVEIAASNRPESTSENALWAILAKNGTAAIDSEIAPPVGVYGSPSSSWATGMSTTMRIRNGNERMALTTKPTMALTTRFGLNRRFSVKYNNSAISVPNTTPMMAETTTIYAVSNNAWPRFS